MCMLGGYVADLELDEHIIECGTCKYLGAVVEKQGRDSI